MSEDIKDMAKARRIITQQRAELAAARVLLREVLDEIYSADVDDGVHVSREICDRATQWLDACDTLGDDNG